MVFSMNTSILPFQLLQSTSVVSRKQLTHAAIALMLHNLGRKTYRMIDYHPSFQTIAKEREGFAAVADGTGVTDRYLSGAAVC